MNIQVSQYFYWVVWQQRFNRKVIALEEQLIYIFWINRFERALYLKRRSMLRRLEPETSLTDHPFQRIDRIPILPDPIYPDASTIGGRRR